jgi:hypothetical protein
VIFIGIGYFLGFISAYMILKINELELKNKIIEKQILENLNKQKNEQNKNKETKIEEKNEQKEEIIKEETEEEKEPLKEEKVEEGKEEEKPKEENNINNDKEIKEEKKPKPFVPHEIKERKVVEEEWTMIKKGEKNRKPQ